MRCQILSSRNSIVFRHKLFFNLVEDLFKWFGNLERKVNVLRESENEKVFDLAALKIK